MLARAANLAGAAIHPSAAQTRRPVAFERAERAPARQPGGRAVLPFSFRQTTRVRSALARAASGSAARSCLPCIGFVRPLH